MRDLHIVLAMAGRGSRFANAGFATPKPLIEVDGQAMFMKALSSLEGIKATKHHTIVMRTEHDQQYDLSSKLKAILPDVNIVLTNEEPTGALRDAYRAMPYIQPNEGVILLDCDLWFYSQPYYDMVEASLSGKDDIWGGLLTFRADNPRYSYAEVDEQWNVKRTAEKKVISDRAITGAYYIASGKVFDHAAQQLLSEPLTPEMPEYFVSHIYNVILGQGGAVKAAPVEGYASFGTPEELAEYESSQA
jgi:dTDP-glucose pyrophosphorylase